MPFMGSGCPPGQRLPSGVLQPNGIPTPWDSPHLVASAQRAPGCATPLPIWERGLLSDAVVHTRLFQSPEGTLWRCSRL